MKPTRESGLAEYTLLAGDDEKVQALRDALGFRYYQRGGQWYARFGSTTWKLDEKDREALATGACDTPKSKEIYSSILNAINRAKSYGERRRRKQEEYG